MKRQSAPEAYTLVMHSGAGYAGKPGFRRGVEERALGTAAEIARVKKVQGFILPDYNAAADRAEKENFPDGDDPAKFTLYPAVRGRFSAVIIDGLRVYIPPQHAIVAEVGAENLCTYCGLAAAEGNHSYAYTTPEQDTRDAIAAGLPALFDGDSGERI